ncbi:ThuA domain-containing protein [Anaerobaca lacustris]|uniref:ThuA domain-containing protein n=1 Tax=Anaerobaca lacustris TaxID=3044600 RepID=A0AAW6U061_9BACT|nr:ThuA domain-containing protein [Sedimentisphaerales bacterium M17dextr]
MKSLAPLAALCLLLAGCTDRQDDSQTRSDAPNDAVKRVVIVTGIDYPGHHWQQTAPALAKVLRADARLDVTVVEDPGFLASPQLRQYDAAVLHFMDWESPDPGPAARGGLQRFVRAGKGLMIVHFGCGAFQEWDEFVKIAGRVWDPNLRGHDPHGSFDVAITDADHPITKGMASFETTDELYTCLAGETPIHILATARSKVDDLDYPIAFVLDYGKGRVFHCVLGHDVPAVENPGAAALFRRGAAWTARLAP